MEENPFVRERPVLASFVAKNPFGFGFVAVFVAGGVLAFLLGATGQVDRPVSGTPVWVAAANVVVVSMPVWLTVVGAAMARERRWSVAGRVLGGTLVGLFAAAAGLASVTGSV
jgi:hypothetical protein